MVLGVTEDDILQVQVTTMFRLQTDWKLQLQCRCIAIESRDHGKVDYFQSTPALKNTPPSSPNYFSDVL